MSETLVSIRRPLTAVSHQEILQSRNQVTLYPDQVKWRKYGQAGLTHVNRGQYARNSSLEGGKLQTINARNVAHSTNQIFQRMPTESHELKVILNGVRFLGEQSIKQIVYMLEPNQLMEEWRRLTHLLDRMNGKQGDWDDFLPHISVATIGQVFAEKALLEEFATIQPEYVLLGPVITTAT